MPKVSYVKSVDIFLGLLTLSTINYYFNIQYYSPTKDKIYYNVQ